MSWREQLDGYIRGEAKPGFKYSHQPRLYMLTEQIASCMEPMPEYDDEVVFAAAFLHDLGVFVGHRPEDAEALQRWDHVAYACERAPGLLEGFGFPAEKVAAVLACIREHQPQDTPRSFEATLLRDADILELLGAIGIARTVTKVGSDTRFHTFADARESLQRAVKELPEKICLEATRTLAQPKVAALKAFLAALEAEGSGGLD